jgi:hypothetical protein
MDTATDSDENIHWHTIVAWQVLNCDGPGSIPDLDSFFNQVESIRVRLKTPRSQQCEWVIHMNLCALNYLSTHTHSKFCQLCNNTGQFSQSSSSPSSSSNSSSSTKFCLAIFAMISKFINSSLLSST